VRVESWLVRRVETGSLPRRYYADTPILVQGDVGTVLFLVTRGLVRLCSVLPSGREVVLALIGPGELFGEAALLGEPSPFEARPVSWATVLPIDARALDAVMTRRPEAASEVVRLLARRLRRTSAALEEALALDVGARVSRRLHDLAIRHGVDGPSGVRLSVSVTQEDLGRMVGASRETVNRSLARLTRRGLVRRDGRRVEIPDLDALARAADGAA
jgi:CRP/FNR family cyclic AMP-dependent transcriptional regulator